MPEVIANGCRIYYELDGPPDAEVLVLLNGILMSTASWGLQVPAFSRRYRVLRHDCRGQWQSEHPAGVYSMAQHADDLAALLDALAIERAHIAGISYGGEAAQAFALEHPARTRSLILADTVSEIGPELRIIVESWLAAARGGNPDLFFVATVPWNFSPDFIAANPKLLADARARYALLDYPAIVQLCECFLGVEFTRRLGEIRAPTCIIVGERDILKGPAYAEILHRGIAHSEYHTLPGAGHASSWERPAEFNTTVLGFLAKL